MNNPQVARLRSRFFAILAPEMELEFRDEKRFTFVYNFLRTILRWSQIFQKFIQGNPAIFLLNYSD